MYHNDSDNLPSQAEAVVLVPHLNGIEGECEQGLGQLEAEGVRVVRRGGCSAIDVARNELISDALHDGFQSMLFIDADIGSSTIVPPATFSPRDASRALTRPKICRPRS